MFAWPPEYTLGKPTDAATSSRCTANASKSICQPPPNSSRFSLEQYNEVCEMLQGVKSNNAQGNRNLSLAAVSAYLKLPHLKTILKMHNIIGYNSGTKQEMLEALLQHQLCNGHYAPPMCTPIPFDDLSALGWLSDVAKEDTAPQATPTTPPPKTTPPPVSLQGARIAICIKETMEFDGEGSIEKLLPGVHIGRVRHQICQDHVPDVCGDVDACTVPGHVFYDVRFKPNESTGQGRIRWVDVPLDLREDLRCDSLGVLEMLGTDDHWCIVEDE